MKTITKAPMNILLIEDDPGDAQLVSEALAEKGNASFHLEQTDRLSTALKRLAQGEIDLVLADLQLPDSQGLDTYLRLRASVPAVPIVVITGALGGEKVAHEAIQRGAQDYLLKEEMGPKTLLRVIRYAIERNRVRQEIRKAYEQTEQLLFSIPSILIGVNQNNLITHWNAVAERTFVIPADSVMNRPFSECKVQWDMEKVLAAIKDCRNKGRTVRSDDVVFRRPNGQKGFLGFSIIPIRQDPEGAVECLLFGADITERRQIEQLKDEFVSTVSHELRTPLTIIREGVSQVLEGIVGSISEEQKKYLAISLEGIDRLGRIVDDLLDISKIEAGRLVLKREPIDIVNLAKRVSSAFGLQAKEKGLNIKTQFPSERTEVYVDKDRMVQVFTNLMVNAFKFTAQGEIRISIAEKGSTVECTVSDTGKGIAEEDLPKVFGKFQQFNREAGPGEKGTGLGLAICKGIVESHHGEIRVESKKGQGTKFIFALPKYTARELFKEHITQSLKEAIKEEAALSIVVFEIENFDALQARWGAEKVASLVHSFENVINPSLRRQADVAVKDTRAILILLPAAGKEEAWMVAGRIQQTFDDYLSKQELQKEVKVSCRVATFPEDGSTAEELLTKAGAW